MQNIEYLDVKTAFDTLDTVLENATKMVTLASNQ
jgi:hypothetical protein